MGRDVPTGIQSVVGIEENKPIELYEMFLDTQTHLFAATPDNVTIGTSIYTAAGIRRSAIRTTMELEVDELAIKCRHSGGGISNGSGAS